MPGGVCLLVFMIASLASLRMCVSLRLRMWALLCVCYLCCVVMCVCFCGHLRH